MNEWTYTTEKDAITDIYIHNFKADFGHEEPEPKQWTSIELTLAVFFLSKSGEHLEQFSIEKLDCLVIQGS